MSTDSTLCDVRILTAFFRNSRTLKAYNCWGRMWKGKAKDRHSAIIQAKKEQLELRKERCPPLQIPNLLCLFVSAVFFILLTTRVSNHPFLHFVKIGCLTHTLESHCRRQGLSKCNRSPPYSHLYHKSLLTSWTHQESVQLLLASGRYPGSLMTLIWVRRAPPRFQLHLKSTNARF